MGCVASKNGISINPALDHSGRIGEQGTAKGVAPVSLRSGGDAPNDDAEMKSVDAESFVSAESRKNSLGRTYSLRFRLPSLQRHLEGDLAAAGWPTWLIAVAGEALHGWVPLKADSFEKLNKIGQGTYSSVYRGREVGTGKIVALKKVQFDINEPESVRFMAREIQILRRLDHPNIMKLEGLIASRLSRSIYFVFEYMDHDLSGLLSSPDIQFSESQVKCYMQQLLSGLEHCHSRGVLHRDIKCANILINNEGTLKIADFGLANFCKQGKKHPLTSRVVTLWYRPPELLLGSTDYGESIDLWSVGCVFAELLLRKPILQGRTEVEQLHKIFKLCGSPPDEYWKKSKLPHATIFKPHQPYESNLKEAFKSFPPSAFKLVETLLSVEPWKRGTAASALQSKYFTTEPFACEPSSLPWYPPNKEMDARARVRASRKRIFGQLGPEAANRSSRASKPSQGFNTNNKLAPQAERLRTNTEEVTNSDMKLQNKRINHKLSVDRKLAPSSSSPKEQISHMKHHCEDSIPFSGPLMVSSSGGFEWARRLKEGKPSRSNSRSSSRDQNSSTPTPSNLPKPRNFLDTAAPCERKLLPKNDSATGQHLTDIVEKPVKKQQMKFDFPDSFDAPDFFHSQDLSEADYLKDEKSSKRSHMYYRKDQGEKVEFSGPLLHHPYQVDQLLQKNERHIRQIIRKSWFQRGAKKET